MPALLTRVPKPASTDINTGIEPLHQGTVLVIFGQPAKKLTVDCAPLFDLTPILKRHIVTESVGPFNVTGVKPAVDSLRKILAEVKAARPDLYAALRSAGMLCARAVRGSTKMWSNHSFGMAVDFEWHDAGGMHLDERGDNWVYQAELDLYPFFHKAGWYWGAGFPTEDGMHFEPGNALVMEWRHAGFLS